MNTAFITLATILNVCFIFKILSMEPIFTDSCTKEKLLENLLANPLVQLEESQKLTIQFWQENAGNDIPEKMKRLKEYEKENPIFLLDEGALDSSLLAKTTNKPYRGILQEMMSESLLKALDVSSNKSVCYLSIGSGGLFQELLIAASVLKKKPNARFIFNFIDIKYDAYLTFRKSIGKEHYISEDDDTVNQKMNVNNDELLTIEAQCKQFIQYLKSVFSECTIFLYLYESIDSYDSYAQKHPEQELTPNAISALGLIDNKNIENATILKYKVLCYKLLKNNKQLPNLWLKNAEDSEIALRSYYIYGGSQLSYQDRLFLVKNDKPKKKEWYASFINFNLNFFK